MADLTEVYAALQRADAAGDTAGAKALADYIRSQPKPVKSYDSLGDGTVAPTGSPAAHAAQDPTSSMSGFQKFAAAYGSAGNDLAQGVGQAVGLTSRQDVQNSRDLNAPLLNTTAGKWGHGIGTVADLAPTMFIPGANTMAGAAAIGAGTGLLQPSTSTNETLMNTGLGGLGGTGGILAGRAAGVGYNAVKSTVQPFFNAGQDAIAARTLQTFAGSKNVPQVIQNIDQNGANVLPGLQPTTAELANNAGLSQLERQMQVNPAMNGDLTQRLTDNRNVMNSALNGIAATPAAVDAAKAARAATVKPLYDAAAQAQVTADPALNSLLQRPSMQSAMTRAQNLAAERGDTLGTPSAGLGSNPYSTVPVDQTVFDGKNIQYLKMALNDMANAGPQMGMGSHEIGAVRSTLGDLNNWTTANVPSLRAADAAFADASKPINQMEIGQALSAKLNPALNDFGSTPRLNANSFANAVRNGDSIAADVTGNARATLADTLNPDQMKTITQIGEQLARRATATDLGRATGSNTAQNLVGQNQLRQILGPMGLPESWGEGLASSSLGQTITRPLGFIAKAGEGNVQAKIADAALNPTEAKRLLQMNIDPSFAKMIWARQGILGNISSSGTLLGNSAQQ